MPRKRYKPVEIVIRLAMFCWLCALLLPEHDLDHRGPDDDPTDMTVEQAAPVDCQGRMASERTFRTSGFIVTNMSRPPQRVVAFYNKRGTAEQ
jgi:hypothetical protein